MSLSSFNSLARSEAVAALLECCGSRPWAEQVADRRPFPEPDAVLIAADEVWWSLTDRHWLEAFSHHPRIGGSGLPAANAREQSGMAAAGAAIRQAFAERSAAYEGKFGHIFLICASGRTGEEMLTQLRERIENEPGAELRIAAGEQARITRLRLERLLA